MANTFHDVPIKFLVRALSCSIFHLKLSHREQREKALTKVREVGEIWCMPRVFPKKETLSSFSHESDFGDCDGTKPRFRRVALQRLPSRYFADCLLVFSRHSAPLIFKQCLRVLPCDPTVSGTASPSILEFSTFPSSVHPYPANS